MKQCFHAPLIEPPELKISDPTYALIESTINKPAFQKSLQKVSNKFSTSYLESFHHLLSVYLPKEKFL